MGSYCEARSRPLKCASHGLLPVFPHAVENSNETAFTQKAFAAVAELQWFLTEQVEEEKTAREIVAKFDLVGNDPASLLDLDRELGSRSAVDAASGAE